MKDVTCHFASLWLAAKQQRWPLGGFLYLAETRAHLRWAVRIIPVRKTPLGQKLKLADLLDPMDKSVLKGLPATLAPRTPRPSARKMSRPSAPAIPAASPPGNRSSACKFPHQPEAQIIRFEEEP